MPRYFSSAALDGLGVAGLVELALGHVDDEEARIEPADAHRGQIDLGEVEPPRVECLGAVAEADVDMGVQRQEPVVDRQQLGVGERVGRGVGRAFLRGGGQGGQGEGEDGGVGGGHGGTSIMGRLDPRARSGEVHASAARRAATAHHARRGAAGRAPRAQPGDDRPAPVGDADRDRPRPSSAGRLRLGGAPVGAGADLRGLGRPAARVHRGRFRPFRHPRGGRLRSRAWC